MAGSLKDRLSFGADITFCATLLLLLLLSAVTAFSQSTDVAFPTAITENQVNGTIRARDLGDPRVTTYYFTFNGLQGDLFVIVVKRILSGSVDIFSTDGMRPLTNILVYADVAQNETGRVIYLRKPEKLILRVQGRTPNDDPAEFQIKFAGGFEAATPTRDEPPVPKVTDLGENSSGIKVNSVGTIIAVTPKPKPSPKSTPAEVAKSEESTDEPKTQAELETKPVVSNETSSERVESAETVSKPAKPTTPRPQRSNRRTTRTSRSEAKNAEPKAADQSKAASAETRKRSKPDVVVTDKTAETASKPKKVPPAEAPNPLANVKLVILFKDGTKVERPMTEVFRFTADQTTLTVTLKNGREAKFSILEVASVTIQ
jgi:hypothetical protein